MVFPSEENDISRIPPYTMALGLTDSAMLLSANVYLNASADQEKPDYNTASAVSGRISLKIDPTPERFARHSLDTQAKIVIRK